MSKAYGGTVTEKTLRSLLSRLRERLQLAIVERETEVQFGNSTSLEEIGPASISGRAFGETTEVRWRYEDGSWAVLVIIDEEAEEELLFLRAVFGREGTLPLQNVGEIYCYLWGRLIDPQADDERLRLTEPAWFERRVPKVLFYPADPAPRLRLRVKVYRVVITERAQPREIGQYPEQAEREGSYLYRFVSPLCPGEEASFHV